MKINKYKIAKVLVLIAFLSAEQCSVFANHEADEHDKKEVLKQKLYDEPANKHWLLSKVAGWKSAIPVVAGSLAGSICCLGKLGQGLRENWGAGDQDIDPETLRQEEIRDSFLFIGGVASLSLMFPLSYLVSYATKKVVREPFFDTFEDFLINLDENVEAIPEELIPLFRKMKQKYEDSTDRRKFIEKTTQRALKMLFQEDI